MGSSENPGTRLREGEMVRTLGRGGQFLQRLNTESPKTKQFPSSARAGGNEHTRAHEARSSTSTAARTWKLASCPPADNGSTNCHESTGGTVFRQRQERSPNTRYVVHSENFVPSEGSQTQRATYVTPGTGDTQNKELPGGWKEPGDRQGLGASGQGGC